jgi:hypothetical protein
MTRQETNGRRPPSRPDLDPDRRPHRQPRGGEFFPFTVAVDAVLLACSTCASLIPNTDRARTRHQRWHEQLAGLEDGRPR